MNLFSRASLLRAALFTTTALSAPGGTLYWDTNGDTAGSGNAGGTWDTGTNWSANAAGGSVVGWTNGENVVFSAATDGVATKAVTLTGSVSTPSILLEEVGLVNITGGTINIAGGSIFNSSVLAGTTGRSLTWTPVVTGAGNLTLAVNGDTSATGGGSNTIFALTGANDFTGDVTVTSGVVGYTSNFGNASNKVVLNGGGLVFNTTGNFTRNIQTGAAGGVLRNYGSAISTLSGTLSGSGAVLRTDGGTAILTGDGSGFTGAMSLFRGTTQIGDGTQTSNLIPNTSGITLGDSGAGSTLRYQLDTSFTLATPITFPNAGSTFMWQGTQAADTLTVNSALGVNGATGTIRVNSGTLALTSGADLRAANFQLASTPTNSATAELGVLSIGPGANAVTRFFDIGQGANNAGKVEQTGGTVTIEAGGSGFRLGHWNNGTLTPGNVYNLSGGLLDASITAVNVGWDGKADMTVGGGAGTATLKGASLAVDANGDTVANASTFTLANNGVAEISGAVTTASVNDKFFLSGGTLRATGSGTWSAAMETAAATTSTFDIGAGFTTTASGAITGSGNLAVTGTGTLSVTSTTTTPSGTFTRTGGTLAGNGVITGTPTINGAVSPGTAANSIGVLDFGDAGTTTTLNGDLRMDLDSSANPATSDLISVFENVTFGAGAVLYPSFNATPVAAVHKLISYFGVRTGAPTLDPNLQVRGLSFALDAVSTPGEVQLAVTGTASPATLVWGGDGVGNAWNLNSTANWSGQTFYQYDPVTFDDSGNNDTSINITGNLTPGAITIDGTKSYTFAGSGSLIGSAPLLKNSSGDLTILNDNKFGIVTINAGNVIVGNGGSTGSIGETGGITIASGTSLKFDRTGSFIYNRPATAGSSGTLIKSGSGTMTIGTAATLLPTNLIVDGGTLNVTGGGFSANRMEGAGQVTVNAAATLVIPAGNAHAFGGDNGTFTESFAINGGTLTLNQEQYFKGLILNGATVNGTADIRSSAANNWQVTGTVPTTMSGTVNNVNATNWNVEDVTLSSAADLLVTGNITGGGATVKNGAGTLRAAGATSNYTGATTITAGTLQTGSARALGFGGAIGNASVNGTTVAAGAVLDLDGNTVNEIVTLNGGGTLTNSNLTTTGTMSNGLAGVRVVDAGSGYTAAPTLAFVGGGGTGATATAAVTTGALSSITTTAAGTGFATPPSVTITGVGTLATASASISQVVLSGTGNQIGGAGNLSVPAVIAGSGSYSKVGAGTLTIPTANSTFTGNLTVEAGTLAATAVSAGTNTGLGANLGSRLITLNGGSLSFGINNVLGNGATAVGILPTIVVNPGATLTTNNYNVLGPVTLNGGTVLDTRTGTPGGYQAFEFKGTVTAGGTTPSLITTTNGWGHHLVGTVGFDVADLAAGTDLTVAAKLLNSSGDNGNAVAGLTKTGAGTLVLNAANSYTGTTTVSAGILSGTGSVAGPLMVAATGTLAPGASAGNFGAGATTLAGTYACEIDGANEDTLVVTGNLDVTGATLNLSVLSGPSLATYVIASYTGTRTGTFATITGLPSGYSVFYNDAAKQIVVTNAATDPYVAWETSNGIAGAGSGIDSDGDGIANGIEFVIGGDPSGPNSNSNALLPTITLDATYMNFVFRRTDESASFNPYVQYGTGLTGWTTAQNNVNGVIIPPADDNFFGAGIDRVTVRIPRAIGTKLFARLRADIP